MLALPLFSHFVHARHDLLAGARLAELIVQQAHGIRVTGEVASNHRVEIPLDEG